MNTEDAATRLGRIVRERRKELKLTQADIQAEGGPSTATLRLIENGKHTDFRASTSQPLERALKWAPGSITSILEGNAPTALTDARTHTSPDVAFVDAAADSDGLVSLDWANDEAAAALQLWPIGGRLLAGQEKRGASTEVMTGVASDLIQISLDITEALIAVMEDYPDLRSRYAGPYSEAVLAVRKFADFHDRHAAPEDKLETQGFIRGFTLMRSSFADHEASTGVVAASLKTHYEEMRKRAQADRRSNTLVAQALNHLQGHYGKGVFAVPELPDDRYVAYLAARLSTPHGGGDPDLHEAVSLDRFEYEAATMRYRRELSEMIVFDGRVKTSTAPAEYITTNRLPPLSSIEGTWLISASQDSVETETIIPSGIRQSDMDLAGGERAAGPSEGRRKREEQDRDAESGAQ